MIAASRIRFTLAFPLGYNAAMFSALPSPGSSRRRFLAQAGGGMGALALASLLSDSASSSPAPSPQSPARVKRVISLFMHGGPRHLDLLEPKHDLIRPAGETLPGRLRP